MSLLPGRYWQYQKATWMLCTACLGACSTSWASCPEHSQPRARLHVGGWFLEPNTYSTDASPCYRVFLVLIILEISPLAIFYPGTKPLRCWAARGFTYTHLLGTAPKSMSVMITLKLHIRQLSSPAWKYYFSLLPQKDRLASILDQAI